MFQFPKNTVQAPIDIDIAFAHGATPTPEQSAKIRTDAVKKAQETYKKIQQQIGCVKTAALNLASTLEESTTPEKEAVEKFLLAVEKDIRKYPTDSNLLHLRITEDLHHAENVKNKYNSVEKDIIAAANGIANTKQGMVDYLRSISNNDTLGSRDIPATATFQDFVPLLAPIDTLLANTKKFADIHSTSQGNTIYKMPAIFYQLKDKYYSLEKGIDHMSEITQHAERFNELKVNANIQENIGTEILTSADTLANEYKKLAELVNTMKADLKKATRTIDGSFPAQGNSR
jgi:hypothetical protein